MTTSTCCKAARWAESRRVPSAAGHHVENHALEMMAGPVMGITVTGVSAEPAESDSDKRRRLRLVARVDDGGTAEEPAFGYTLERRDDFAAVAAVLAWTDASAEARRAGEHFGGEPAPGTDCRPLARHRAGELLRRGGWLCGRGYRIASAIPPGGSFEARFTPPRSGTFIYHTHIDEVRQMQAGLSGALLVLDPPETSNPEHDIVLLVTVPRKNPAPMSCCSTAHRHRRRGRCAPVSITGCDSSTSTPSARTCACGYCAIRRCYGGEPSPRTALICPPDQRIEGPSEIQMGNGETFRFRFRPVRPWRHPPRHHQRRRGCSGIDADSCPLADAQLGVRGAA